MNILIRADADKEETAVVALVTRTKNRPALLERALHSVLAQSFQSWVHVIVNDGGDVAVLQQLLSAYLEPYAGRLVLVSSEMSEGMEAASNAGIRNSESEFIVIHDDDDSLEPEFLEKTVSYLREPGWPNVRGVVTLSNLVCERVEGGKVTELSRSLYRPMRGCIRISDMAVVNQYAPISFLFRRDTLQEVGLYDERLPVLGDWDFNLRFLAKFDIGVLPEALANYHQRPSNFSQQYGNSLFAQQDRHALYDGLIRNAWLRTGVQQGQSGLGLLLNLKPADGSARRRRRLFDPLYRLPGFSSGVRWLRSRGYLLNWTRSL